MTDTPDKMRDADAERLRDLAKDIPWERPTAARRDGIRSSLLVEAAESNAAPSPAPRRYLAVGSAFVAGVLAAAAVAILLVRRDGDASRAPITPTQITASPDAKLDHQIVTTDTGVDEIVQIRDGKVRLAVPAVRRGDHVRVQTKTADVEGDAGEIEVVVIRDSLESVTVRTGTARVVVGGRATFLSAGQTWRASIVTTDLTPDLKPDLKDSPDQVAVRAPDAPDTNVPPTDTTVRSSDASDTTVRSPDAAVRSPDKNVSSPDKNVPPPSVTPTDKNVRLPNVPPTDTARTGDSKPVVAFDPPKPTIDSKSTKGDATKGDATKGDATNRNTTNRETTKGDATNRDTKPEATNQTTKPDAMKPTIVEPAKPDRSKQTAIEQQFRKGWELLRTGKAREAAVELGAAADAMPESPLAADARYWQAVALIRAGQARDAERVLVQFLDNAPKSLRRGRAAVLLGRVLAERGERKSATAWFESALNDPDPAIANAARAGLQAVQKSK